MSFAQENGAKNWGVVTGDFIDGIGHIGPENAVDNRAHKIMISGSSFSPIVFSNKDVKSVDVVCTASEWIKYRICLKDGKVAIATFMNLTKDPMGMLTFEWWLADVIYQNAKSEKKAAPKKENTVEEQTADSTPAPAPAKKAAPKKKESPKEENPKEEVKKAPAKKKAAPTKEEPKKEAVEEQQDDRLAMLNSIEDPKRLYQFAKDMMGAKSYYVAYYALKKLKKKTNAYKDIDKLLEQVKDEVEYALE